MTKSKTVARVSHPYLRDSGQTNDPTITMSLTGMAYSDTAKNIVSLIASETISLQGNRRHPSPQYISAVGALIADLLNASRYSPPRQCYRRLAVGSFTGGPVGYDAFRRALDDLAFHGLLVVHLGNAAFANDPGRVSRIEPTAHFIERLTAAGIAPADRLAHFTHAPDSAELLVIQKRAGNRRTPTWKKIKGRPLPVDMSEPKVAAMAEQVDAINAYMAAQVLSVAPGFEAVEGYDGNPPVLPDDLRFFRSFNCGDDPAFNWNMGGRLCVVGGGYQSIKKVFRPFILINDEPTVEIDVTACHLTIAYGLLGLPLPDADDLYKAGDIDREAVKLFVNSSLGGGKLPSKWTTEHCLRFDKDDVTRLRREFPISIVRPSVSTHLPVLKTILDSGLSWANYQFVEGEVSSETVYRLLLEGICALPNHDSIRVPAKDLAVAKGVFSSTFHKHVGILPYTKVK